MMNACRENRIINENFQDLNAFVNCDREAMVQQASDLHYLENYREEVTLPPLEKAFLNARPSTNGEQFMGSCLIREDSTVVPPYNSTKQEQEERDLDTYYLTTNQTQDQNNGPLYQTNLLPLNGVPQPSNGYYEGSMQDTTNYGPMSFTALSFSTSNLTLSSSTAPNIIIHDRVFENPVTTSSSTNCSLTSLESLASSISTSPLLDPDFFRSNKQRRMAGEGGRGKRGKGGVGRRKKKTRRRSESGEELPERKATEELVVGGKKAPDQTQPASNCRKDEKLSKGTLHDVQIGQHAAMINSRRSSSKSDGPTYTDLKPTKGET